VKLDDGQIQILVNRTWAPHGSDRLWQLLQPSVNYYEQNGFFRYVPNFVVQFGINGNPKVSQYWENQTIPDDPVLVSNLLGTVAYADAGPDTRTTQLFINFANNSYLDPLGFAPFGMVTKGMNVAVAIYGKYGQDPDQTLIYEQGNSYLKKHFPKLDYILTASATQSN